MMHTQSLTRIALCAALLTIGSWVALPLGAVPFTLQIMMVYLVAMVLTPKQAFFTVAVWMLLGAVGLPVFAYFNRGVSYLLGPTGGYILGFLIAAPLISALKDKWRLLIPLTILMIYLVGSLGIMRVKAMPFLQAYKINLPFLPFDLLKIALAMYIAPFIRKSI